MKKIINDKKQTKTPPHSVEAEKALLGGVMLDNAAWKKISEIIKNEDFYSIEHKYIFDAITHIAEKNNKVDMVTVAESLETNNKLQKIGGISYLTELSRNTHSIHNIVAYADIVRECSNLRNLIRISKKIAEEAFNRNGKKVQDIIHKAEKLILTMAESRYRVKKTNLLNLNELLNKTINSINKMYSTKSSMTGLLTGFNELDNMTSGFQKADLIIIAGRPSMGKTSFAMNIVEYIIKTNKSDPVIIFSMEMPAEQLILRLLSSVGRIDQTNIRKGNIGEEDWLKLTESLKKIKNCKLYIDDTPMITPIDIRKTIKKCIRDTGKISLIMIDYLQLMHVSSSFISYNRTAEISEISRSLKSIAKEFNCPILAVSQLNRSLEQRNNKRPIISDLRESGAIEQDADLILFIYRDEVYNSDCLDNKGIAELIIGKQRNGPIGVINIRFTGKYTKFEN
ncbi:replicative DNA helicase [Candidatus Portiera aleyrodidarum]|uniref:Replicative DNA helicase n=1 Tax=Candidatus Portiera aleyrodidarum MED (Bemisia tabaci) TaxID=1163752 RepID=A0AAU8RP77_9GAMM|nr:replicative DNA helicase [Candidatus Portiera aleyrodidarum]AFQ24092.1 primary replicative DNA helicase [Candidatus Portiera aleyrodidarum BT-B-HRs]AJF24067.1 DNA helicase [Candidatus Portiera aleyrodidarum MED (Bemisia tabaci)]ASX27110.1 replicative DNA helicase [Candidatus Portiera aleyrodidarum MED (Bemisia tabaci)]